MSAPALAGRTTQHIPMRSAGGALLVLGLREARRMLLSPVLLLLLAFAILMGGVRSVVEMDLSLPTAQSVYDVVTFFSALYLGLLVYSAAHLVTSSARRTGAEAQLASSALSERQRRTGLCLGVIFGPGLLGLLLMATVAILGNGLEVTNVDGFNAEAPLAGIFLVQVVLVLIGGGLFGVMWATWLRFPGSLPLGFVVLVFGTVWLSDGGRAPLNTWPWFVPYITAPGWYDAPWTSAGSHSWHTVYLIGLCVLAFCATMLRSREGRGRWIVISGAAVAGTAIAGAMQLW